MKKRLSITLAVMIAIVSASVYADGTGAYIEQSAPAALFPDTKISDWYYPHMKILVGKGGINGYDNGMFQPDNTITNAEFVKIIVGLVEETVASVDTHWAEGYIQKAVALGIVQTDELPQTAYDEPIRRQSMAKFAARTMEKVLNEMPTEDTSVYTKHISDWSDICETCKPYVAQVYSKGVICGMPDGSFSGGSYATRAEAATMLVRMIDAGYRVKMYSGIAFHQKTDVLDDGRMSAEKSKEFMDYTLKNLKFYKENGKYYVSGAFPELPAGFENWLTIDAERNDGGAVISYTNGFTMIEEQKIPSSGDFKKEIAIPSPDKINFIHIKIGVNAKENQVTQSRSAYYNINTTHRNRVSFVKETDEATEYIEYNFSKLFQW